MRRISLVALLMILIGLSVQSQTYLGIYPNQNLTPLITNGPTTVVSGLQFAPNTNANATPSIGAISVSAEYTSQVYPMVNELPSVHPSMMFGAQSNNTAKVLGSKPLLVAMQDVASPISTYYSPTESLTGMDPSSHYAFEQYVSVEELLNQDLNTNGEYFMGTVTYTFSQPVDNPIIHITGLGGFFSSSETLVTQIFSVDYELVTGGAATSLLELSSTTFTELVGNRIKNVYDYTNYAYNDPFGANGTFGDEAGTGSYVVVGTGITTVSFKLYMMGKCY